MGFVLDGKVEGGQRNCFVTAPFQCKKTIVIARDQKHESIMRREHETSPNLG
jgi:hypothetical protein